MIYLYIIIVNIILLISLYIVYKRKLHIQKSLAAKQAADAYVQSRRKELEEIAQRESKKLYDERDQLRRDVNEKLSQLSSLNGDLICISKTIAEQRERARINEEKMRESAEQMAKAYEADLLKVAEQKVALQREGMWKAAQQIHAEEMAQLSAQTEAARASLATLEQAVLEYSIKQVAINEAILRQRAIEEQQDFYRVCLSEETIADIAELQTIRQKLKKPEIIDKIIYDTYVAKPVLEMIKRVLQNTTCSGIYKITCQKTKEIYIGKSTDVKNRWQQHCKTAFNCGTIASSILHRKMQQYGIENFTFELIEKVPKDQLSEREAFYVDFYQSKEFGMNERKGG